ncbi:hypothetical protein A2U01_0019107, partial [Trifolium medium]|nr:hypothetical protein [Trifolium medium]
YPPSVLPVVSNARIRTSSSEHPSTDPPQVSSLPLFYLYR